MKRIFSVSVENRAGVLSKVSSLFARRGYNIESLTVGETHDPTISNMTIVSSGSPHDLEQIEKQLNKKLDVIKVRTFKEEDSVSRELILVKIKYTAANRSEIIE
ncbi:MAG: acetolactate synthase small subunit, partial [Lachnospiraceae bacterium]|nr:acetolactate synthase small subunit [Lachnospiraceae bacterium]